MKPIANASTEPAPPRADDPRPDVLRLADLAAYQEGAVVSRQIVKKAGGTVTVFAFADGQGLSEHTAPFDALVQVLDGAADVVISGATFRVSAGEAIVLPANRPHSLAAVTPFKMLLTMIRSPA